MKPFNIIRVWPGTDVPEHMTRYTLNWASDSFCVGNAENDFYYQEYVAEQFSMHLLVSSTRNNLAIDYQIDTDSLHLFIPITTDFAVYGEGPHLPFRFRRDMAAAAVFQAGEHQFELHAGLSTILYFTIPMESSELLKDFLNLGQQIKKVRSDNFVCPSIPIGYEIDKLVESMLYVKDVSMVLVQPMVKKALYSILVDYDTELFLLNERPDAHLKYRSIVKHITDEIDFQPDRDKHTDRYFAEKYHVGHVTLNRYFLKYTGTTIAAYRHRRSMKMAQEMIQQGLPIYHVAETIGYYDVSGFCNAFKLHFGHKPTAYRHRTG